jgi:hypothetical protein
MAKVSFLLRHLANLFAPGLIVLLPYFGFIRFNDYPFWRPEVLLVAAAILVLGMPLGFLVSVRPKTFGAAVITVLLLALAIETFLTSLYDDHLFWDSVKVRLGSLAGTRSIEIAVLAAFVVIAGATFFLAGRLDRNLGLVVATAFGIGALSTFAVPGEKILHGEYYRGAAVAQADLPPVIHLVLDEHIGLQGLPSDIEGADELRDELISFYDGFGFRVFGRAYSQYAATKLSLATMLMGQPHPYILSEQDADAFEANLRRNPWFDDLAERGYRLRIYHSYDVDFCGRDEGRVYSCYGYSANTVKVLQDSGLPVFTLVRAITARFLDTLIVYKIWLDRSPTLVRQGAFLPEWLRQQHKYAASASLPVLDHVLQDLRREPRGSAYFVHLLIPHHTYLYDEDCRIKPEIGSWMNNVSPDADFAQGLINTEDSRTRSYVAYFDQLRCTRRALEDFFKRLQETGAFEDGTIIVHGDHGSRIALAVSKNGTARAPSDVDLVDLHSVLFAVRGPGFESGYDHSLRSLQALFAEAMLRRSPAQEPNDVVLTFLSDLGYEEQIEPWPRVPMPAFAEARPKQHEVSETPAQDN